MVFKIDHALSALSKEISKNDGKAHAALFRINTKSVPLLGPHWRSAERRANCGLPKHSYLKGGQCPCRRASFRACSGGLVVKWDMLLSVSMARRHHLGRRRQQSSGAPTHTQTPPSGFSDTNEGLGQNTPVIPIVPVTGVACSKFRDGQLTDTTEK